MYIFAFIYLLYALFSLCLVGLFNVCFLHLICLAYLGSFCSDSFQDFYLIDIMKIMIFFTFLNAFNL